MNPLQNNYLKRYLIFFLILSLSFYPVLNSHAETKISQEVFAVVDFSNDTGDPEKDYLQKGLANSLITSLGSYSNELISIVERGQLNSLIKEMGLSSTGVVDSSNAVKLGNALGATQIIVGGLVRTGRILRLNVRVINVKTSRLTLAMSEDSRSEEELLSLIDKVAEKIVAKINNTEKITDNRVNPVESFLEPPKETKVLPAEKIDIRKENHVEKNDNMWLWVVGGVIALTVLIVILVPKSQPYPVYSQPIQEPVDEPSVFPSIAPTNIGQTPLPVPIGGGTSDLNNGFNINIKF
jgi:TolB-like protein